MPEALELQCLANRLTAPVIDQAQLIFILMSLTPGEQMAASRMPLNFTLLLDHSGSMAGEKLRTMKAAVNNLIDQLSPDDILSIVTFETRTHVLIPAQPARHPDELKSQVDSIRDAGGTNMARGLQEALKQVSQHAQEGRVSRIVLLTDGEATDKADDSRRAADMRITSLRRRTPARSSRKYINPCRWWHRMYS